MTGSIVGLLTFAVATGLSYFAYVQLTTGALVEVEGHIAELERTKTQMLPLLSRDQNMLADSPQRLALEGVMKILVAEMVTLNRELDVFKSLTRSGIRERVMWLGMRNGVAGKLEVIRNLKMT
ncbi:hypothetical protein B0A48_11445 [Cryoendolithus antarcticus]|uniref:Uncharacterized protein n=1 Tax=Cryoendolithus antarcticus TaxID=1507870 RepID=A0A1V8SVW0_9PEZI|nr:hypothetical protein B0A48_11445 [Cryoendolithus antarcticus]